MSKEKRLKTQRSQLLRQFKSTSNTNSNRRGRNLSIYLRVEHIDKLNRLCSLYKKKPSQLIQDLIDMHYGMIHLIVQEMLAKMQKSKINKNVLSEIISEIIEKSSSTIEKLTEKESS